jgi:YD repeat-containing protein
VAPDPWWRPVPNTDGSLLSDPELTLPTTAGPLVWRLYHDSTRATQLYDYGRGWRGSFPLRLDSDGTTVTVEHEDGGLRQYRKQNGTYAAVGPATGDTLVRNADNTWDETLGESGYVHHFDAAELQARCLWRQSPQGLRLTYHWTAPDSRFEAVEEPTGRRVTVTWQTGMAGRIKSLQDWGQRRITFDYISGSRQSAVTGPTGCQTQYEYEAWPSYRITKIQDPGGYATSFTYDAAGRVWTRSVAGSLGQYTYVMDGSTLQTGYTDPEGHTWTHLTSGGYPTGKMDPLGNRETYSYVNGHPLEFVNGLGNSTSFAFDSQGFQTAERDALGNRWTYTRDSYGNVTEVLNPLGYRTTYGYGSDASKRQLESILNPLGERTTIGYLANGLPQYTQDMLGHRTTQVWSDTALLQETIDPLGRCWTYQYDSVANRTEMLEPTGTRWTAQFDPLGQWTCIINPFGDCWTRIYDDCCSVKAEVDPLGCRTTYSYNAERSMTERQDALGNCRTWVYGSANRLMMNVNYFSLPHWITGKVTLA